MPAVSPVTGTVKTPVVVLPSADFSGVRVADVGVGIQTRARINHAALGDCRAAVSRNVAAQRRARLGDVRARRRRYCRRQIADRERNHIVRVPGVGGRVALKESGVDPGSIVIENCSPDPALIATATVPLAL